MLLPQIRQRREQEAARTGVHVGISNEWYLVKEGEDVTRKFLKSPPSKKQTGKQNKNVDYDPAKVFIVHGHDDVASLN